MRTKGGEPTYKVRSVRRKGHLKMLELRPGPVNLAVPLSACVSKDDSVRITGMDAWVDCRNGEAQFLEPYLVEEDIAVGGLRLPVLVKEITEGDEHRAYLSLADFHYRGHAVFGRTARLIVRTFHRQYPKVLGYVELATPFYMNKARTAVLDAPFKLGSVRWDSWDMNAVKKYVHVLVRIARVVVCPEFRGLGIGQLLIEHAAGFAGSRWQVAGYLPYFLEISADMLRYVPFAEKAGMTFVGETEGNLSRVAKDMSYLIRRFRCDDEARSAFEETCGICDQQVARMNRSLKLMKKTGMNKRQLSERLSGLAEKGSLRDFAQFSGIVTLPKPHYMMGLNEEASRFLNSRVSALPHANWRRPPEFMVEPAADHIHLRDISVSYVSHVRRTQSTHAVQRAFGISPDHIASQVIRRLSLTIDRGEILLVVGPSGSGKTTLMNLLGGHQRRPPGIRIKGRIVFPPDARLGTFQPIRSRKPLIELFSKGNISSGLYVMGLAGLSEVFLYLKRFEELSKGQQYRAMLARLIASGSNIWIADEFCTNLDPITANVVAHNVQKVARQLGATLVAAVPHCSSFVSSLKPDRVLLLTSTWEHSLMTGKEYCEMMAQSAQRDGNIPSLGLLPRFFSAVHDGRKRATVRLGHKHVEAGLLFLESNRKKIPVRVTRVHHKSFSELTNEDAVAEGLRNVAALKRTLESIYPRMRSRTLITVIHFEPICGELKR